MPVTFADILLFSKDSLLVEAKVANEGGEFYFTIPPNEYLLKIKKLSEVLYFKTILIVNNTDLGTITVNTSKELQNVVVEGKKKLIERKSDRLVFNVENSMVGSGTNAIDVLKATPRIYVQNNGIAMIGKSNVAVMIDDHIVQLSGDDLINFLKTIRSDDIKRIEIIHNPPAKYDAEGNSGLVNVILKKSKKDSWNASVQTEYEQAAYPSGGLGAALAFQKNNWSISTNTSYNNGSNAGKASDKYNYSVQTWDEESNKRQYDKILSGRLGIDYKLSGIWSMGVLYIGGNSTPDENAINLVTLSQPSDGNIDSLIHTHSIRSKRVQSNILNWHSSIDLDTLGRHVELNFDYLNYTNNQELEFNTQNLYADHSIIPYSSLSIKNLIGQQTNIYSGKIDITYPGKWADLQFGGKMSFTGRKNDIQYYDLTSGIPVADPLRSNRFNYDESIQAVYISGNKKFGKDSWETRAGLRMENTLTKGYSINLNQTNKRNYLQLFPTFYISYTPNETHSFSIDYGRRIDRPRYTFLNPFQVYTNQFSYTQGNPYLQPAFTHNIEFGHVYKNNLSSSCYYAYTTNGYSAVTMLYDSTLYKSSKPINYYRLHEWGLNENYTFNKFKHWESINSLNISWSQLYSSIPTIQNTSGMSAFISSSNSFTLNKYPLFIASLDLSYSFPSTYLYTLNKGSFYAAIGGRWLLLKKRLQLNITVSDIFRSNRQRWTETNNEIQSSHMNYSGVQNIRLSLTYKLKNSTLKVKEKKIGSSEERNRVKE